jgi:hypothetical protein
LPATGDLLHPALIEIMCFRVLNSPFWQCRSVNIGLVKVEKGKTGNFLQGVFEIFTRFAISTSFFAPGLAVIAPISAIIG